MRRFTPRLDTLEPRALLSQVPPVSAQVVLSPNDPLSSMPIGPSLPPGAAPTIIGFFPPTNPGLT